MTADERSGSDPTVGRIQQLAMTQASAPPLDEVGVLGHRWTFLAAERGDGTPGSLLVGVCDACGVYRAQPIADAVGRLDLTGECPPGS